MKPILLNTEEVRAILDGRKSVTRRVVRPQPDFCVMTKAGLLTSHFPISVEDGLINTKLGNVTTWEHMPYRPGDILYVRETWNGDWCDHYIYKADGGSAKAAGYSKEPKWRPSIHMPKEAARLFLRVTGVRVERLQDMTGHDVLAEGVENGHSNPTMGKRWENMQRMAFSDLWNRTIKKADLPLCGWAANPWVWVVEFERISEEEAMK